MATYNQIYNLMNKVSAMALGESAVTVTDTSSLVSLGNQVLSTAANLDAFYQALPDVIGRIVSRYQQIKRRTRDIERSPLDFGIAVMEIEVDEIARAKKNRTWSTSKVDPFASQENHTGTPPTVDDINGASTDVYEDDTHISASIYSVIAGWEIDKIIYDRQLKTAFRSEAEMAAFVNMIFNDMYNGMTIALNSAESEAECTAIAQEYYASTNNGGTQKTSVNLAQVYYDATGTDITNGGTDFEAWQTSEAFLKCATRKMKNDLKNATQVSNFYTPAAVGASGTPVERELGDFRIHVLNDFASANEFYLLANTYHENFVNLGGYSEVICWNGRGTGATGDTFAEKSKVIVQHDFDRDGDLETVTLPNVVAHIFADGRMMSMVDDIRTKSQYNPIGERTTYAHKADIGYAVRPKEIGITYYIAAPTS